MEKKLKLNAFLKGVSIFAFVAFCLLAILAGVTLPFVSNASTAASVVVDNESDCATASAQTQNLVPGLNYNLPDYIKTVKKYNQLTDNEAIYGIAFNEFDIADFWSIASTSAYSGYAGKIFILPCGFKLDNIDWYLEIMCDFSDVTRVKFSFTAVKSDNSDSAVLNHWDWFPNPYSNLDNPPVSFCLNYFLAPKCFFSSTHSPAMSAFFPVFTDKMLDSIYFITEINSGTTEIEYISNYGFWSRFGFVDSIPSSNLYVNLQEKPIIPDSVRRVTAENSDNLINGWIHGDWEYYLPLTNAYDGFGNPIDGGFTGWYLTNIEVNGVHSSNYNIWFEVLNQKVFNIGIGTIINGYLNIEISESNKYLVESNFTNSENLLVFSKLNNSFKYYLQPNISQNDVYKFFALIDYRNYTPSDNEFYVAGFNSASKGYYDTGYNNGYNKGKTDGYNTGFSAGDSQGYARGVESANTYSFLGLFGAIFDAPIKAIFGGTSILPAGTTITDSNGNTITLQSTTTVNRAGLLNFNLMGVNLSGFVLALFSLSILVVVIKFALAKGR